MKALRTLMCCGCIITAIAFTGCQITDDLTKGKAEEEIVVIDQEELERNDNILKKIEEFEDVLFMGWLSDTEVLMTKAEENDIYNRRDDSSIENVNIYTFDFVTGKETILATSDYDISHILVSPDKKHLFYKRADQVMNTGFIRNLESDESVQLTESIRKYYGDDGYFNDVGQLSTWEGAWLDDENLIFAEEDGKIYIASVEGEKTQVMDIENRVYDVRFIDGKYIYLTSEGVLEAKAREEEKSEVLFDYAINHAISPDGTKIALVREVYGADLNVEVLVTDIEGKPLMTLSSGSQIRQVSWSPDSSKLAYGVNTGGKVNSMYIADIDNGQLYDVLGDFTFIEYPLCWSPDSKRLSVVIRKFGDNMGPQYKSYIISLTK